MGCKGIPIIMGDCCWCIVSACLCLLQFFWMTQTTGCDVQYNVHWTNAICESHLPKGQFLPFWTGKLRVFPFQIHWWLSDLICGHTPQIKCARFSVKNLAHEQSKNTLQVLISLCFSFVQQTLIKKNHPRNNLSVGDFLITYYSTTKFSSVNSLYLPRST